MEDVNKLVYYYYMYTCSIHYFIDVLPGAFYPYLCQASLLFAVCMYCLYTPGLLCIVNFERMSIMSE